MSISYVEIYNEMMYDLLATLPDQDNTLSNPLVIAEVSQCNNNITIHYNNGYRIIKEMFT